MTQLCACGWTGLSQPKHVAQRRRYGHDVTGCALLPSGSKFVPYTQFVEGVTFRWEPAPGRLRRLWARLVGR
jgi:hypothetical protein